MGQTAEDLALGEEEIAVQRGVSIYYDYYYHRCCRWSGHDPFTCPFSSLVPLKEGMNE